MSPGWRHSGSLLAVAVLIGCHGGRRPDSPRPPAPVAPAAFELHDSETLDAATFLNAISDNPRFNAGWSELRARWRAKFAAAAAAAASLRRWLGTGIQLAYLLSALPEHRLTATIARLEQPEAVLRDMERGLDEPAYRPILDRLRTTHADVRRIFQFLLRHGFLTLRAREYGALRAETRRELEAALRPIDAARFRALLEAYSGRPVPDGRLRLYVLAFARPYCFQLSGFAIGWSKPAGSAPWLLAHELLHKFNPSRAALEHHRRLRADPFYARAWDRIYGEYSEGKEEEMVEAAALAVVDELGLLSRQRILRRLKWAYFSPRTQQGGQPLAAILFDELRRAPRPTARFDYNAFIEQQLRLLAPFGRSAVEARSASGAIHSSTLERRFREIIRPISGTAGLSLDPAPEGARVKGLLPGRAAALAGLQVGDHVIGINDVRLAGRDLEAILDLLAGPPGAALRLEIERGGERRRLPLRLGE